MEAIHEGCRVEQSHSTVDVPHHPVGSLDDCVEKLTARCSVPAYVMSLLCSKHLLIGNVGWRILSALQPRCWPNCFTPCPMAEAARAM